MIRIWLAIGLIGGLGIAVAATLKLDTDVRQVFGPDDRVSSVLDTPEGRLATLAIIAPDRDRRSKLAAEIAAGLSAEPLVGRVMTGPEAPPPELIDWIWRYRFVLAPPAAADFDPASLAAEMRRARGSLTSMAGGALADRYLLDPTGSFRRLIEAISAPDPAAMALHQGIPQSRDDTAALIFLSLADSPFDSAAQAAFDQRLADRVRRGGAEALMIGPRPLSAHIGNQIAARAKFATLVACCLLLLWLLAALRPARNVLICLAPLATGFLAAVLSVQVVFGSVHVIALGFGGALMGLAIDYPIHLLAHRRRVEDAARARRYIGLCAVTTGVAFMALTGSGIPALAQVGVFVACGLAVSATVSAALPGEGWAASPGFGLHSRRPIAAPWKLPALVVASLVSVAALWLSPDRAQQRLIEPPADVIQSIERMGRLVDLPSGRYRIDVTGGTLADVLDRQAALMGVLDAAERDGTLDRAGLLAAHLPARPEPGGPPEPEVLAARLPVALAEAGLAPGFAAQIIDAYTAARSQPSPGPGALEPLTRMPELAALIAEEGEVLRAPVRLWGLSKPERLGAAVDSLADAGIVFVDQEAAIASGLDALTGTAARWMATGAAVAIGFLFLTLRPVAAAVEIVLACLAAGLATAAAASILAGGLGIFHVVALALVIGIGIDYGLFLTLSESGEEFATAIRSVLICAGSTLIAFLTMALSGVNVLEDIGTTLSIGVVAMLAVHLLRRRELDAQGQ